MKKLLLPLIIIFSLVILTQSCKKSANNNNQQTTSPNIKKNQSFQYDFGLIGIEDGLTISHQSNHFEISTLVRDNSGKIIYYYKPGLNYVGKDEVEITRSLSNGATVIKTIKTIIKFTITE